MEFDSNIINISARFHTNVPEYNLIRFIKLNLTFLKDEISQEKTLLGEYFKKYLTQNDDFNLKGILFNVNTNKLVSINSIVS